MIRYIALLRKEKDTAFGVDFPDFPGCVTAGDTAEEARKLAVEALEFHIDGLLEDGEELPRPTSFDDIVEDPLNRDALAFLVGIKDRRPVYRRVNVSLPQTVLDEIDRFTRTNHLSRSQFLVRASQNELRRVSTGDN